MTDDAVARFLAWAAPRLGLRAKGVSSFPGTIGKRLKKRLRVLGLGSLDEYHARLEADPAEWPFLEAICRIPISRLYRDREVFDLLAGQLLPERAHTAAHEGRPAVRVWSAGCASGEEPYTVAMIWRGDIAPHHPGVALELLATDADSSMIARAQRGVYAEGSLQELPARMRAAALAPEGPLFRVRDEVRSAVTFRQEDLRGPMPDGPFDVILCRNVLLTYLDEATHLPTLDRLVSRLVPGGVLVVGLQETMPSGLLQLEPLATGVYRRRS